MRVLLGWDLGAGRGHAVRLAALADAFVARGDEVLLLARDLRTLRAVAGHHVQLPLPHNNWFPRDVPPASWADILWIEAGLHDGAQAQAILLAWRDLFAQLAPDLVVLDACPLAAPAARALDIPTLSIGSGFMQPPPGPPWPVFRDWEPVDRERLQRREAAIAAWCAAAGTWLDGDVVRLDADRSVYFTHAAFDHYGARAGRYVGPMAGCGEAPVWPSGERRVLVYLQPHYPYLDALHAALAARDDLAVLFYCGDRPLWPDAPWLKQSARPVDLSAALAEAHLVIGHGGTMAVQAAIAGVPQLLLPIHAETFLLARRLQMLGLARSVAPPLQAAEFGPALDALFDLPSLQARATELVGVGERLDDEGRCAAVLEAADALAGRRRDIDGRG